MEDDLSIYLGKHIYMYDFAIQNLTLKRFAVDPVRKLAHANYRDFFSCKN